VALQHTLAKRAYFTVKANLNARASESKVEPSDPREERVQFEYWFHWLHVIPFLSGPVGVPVDRCLAAQKADP
jgi:hypothetical protein